MNKVIDKAYLETQLKNFLSSVLEKRYGVSKETNNAILQKDDGLYVSTDTFNTQSDWNETSISSGSYIKNKPTLGTSSSKDVASSGNASSTQVVMGNDTRLTDSRNAKDVYSWAKSSSKPTYSSTELSDTSTLVRNNANQTINGTLSVSGNITQNNGLSLLSVIGESSLSNGQVFIWDATNHRAIGVNPSSLLVWKESNSK